MNPSVSVLLATYNRAHLLRRAVESVLNQSLQDFELIIVDDCSADDTPNRIEELKKIDSRIVSVQTDENVGVAAARNAGLRYCTSPLIAFMDDDDAWTDVQKLIKQRSYLDANPKVDAVCTSVKLHSSPYDCVEKIVHPPKNLLFHILVGNGIIYNPTVLVRRPAIDLAGGFDERMTRGVDSDFMRTIVSRGAIVAFMQDITATCYTDGHDRMTTTKKLRTPRSQILNNYVQFRKHAAAYIRHPRAAVLRLTHVIVRILMEVLPARHRPRPIALIKSGNMNNLGDLMMVNAIADRLSPHFQIAVMYGSMNRRDAQRRKWLLVVPSVYGPGIPRKFYLLLPLAFAFNRLPRRILAFLGYASDTAIHAYLDTSGFGYGSPWPESKLFLGRALMRKFEGAKRFILPQSLGNLGTSAARVAASDLLSSADVVFVRDRPSLEKWGDVARQTGVTLREIPDFTISLARDNSLKAVDAGVLLFPSHRAETVVGAEKFNRFFLGCAEVALDAGHMLRIIPHDLKYDRDVCARLASAIGDGASYERYESLEEIRSLIQSSPFIVSSRFHALMNAFGHGVPAIALGWSEKFQAVLAEYGMEQYCFNKNFDIDIVASRCRDLLDIQINKRQRNIIEYSLNRTRKQVEGMWQNIENELGHCTCSGGQEA